VTESAEGTFRIINERGMHARAAAKLVHLASGHSASVRIEKDGIEADAKSIMGVLLLCGQRGTEVTVRAEGQGAAAVVEAIGRLIADRFGEEA